MSEEDIKSILIGFNSKFDLLRKDVEQSKVSILNEIDAKTQSITNDILNIRETIIQTLIKENRMLKTRVSTLEMRLADCEKQANEVEQNNRKNNVELDGIPANIVDLKPTVAKIMNHLTETEINESEIEAVHRLHSKKDPKPVILRMKRNLLDEARKNRAKLKDIASAVEEIPPGTKIYLNENLSPNMKSLAYNARLLKKDGVIADTWFANAAVRLKCLNGKYEKVTHEHDLCKLFPTFDKFTFDTDFYDNIYEDTDIDEYADLAGISFNQTAEMDQNSLLKILSSQKKHFTRSQSMGGKSR